MQPMYYIGLDVHKRKISYCVKDSSGKIHTEGSISATRLDLDHWMRSLWLAVPERFSGLRSAEKRNRQVQPRYASATSLRKVTQASWCAAVGMQTGLERRWRAVPEFAARAWERARVRVRCSRASHDPQRQIPP
jgi:hypothetical protein